MESQFAPALTRLQFLMTKASDDLKIPIKFALIGGLSVAAWGVVRATQDIDLLADSDPSPIGEANLRDRLQSFFERHHCRVEWRVGTYDDPIPLLLRLKLPRSYGGLEADILWAHRRWQREALLRSINVHLRLGRVPILHPEDLILLKLDAGGPKDFADVEGLLTDPPSQLNVNRLKETATRLRLRRALEKCLRQSKAK